MKSKLMFLLSVGLMWAASATADTKDGWLTDYNEARKQAAIQNKPILMDFSGSTWCGWCQRLDSEVFSKKEFKEYAGKNLILLVIDVPNPRAPSEAAKTLAAKYKLEGFPTVLFLDKNGNEIAKRTGYRRGGAASYVKHIKERLAKARE